MRVFEFKDYGVKVFENGEILNKKGRKLAHVPDGCGYPRVYSMNKLTGKRIGLSVHRLLALAFIPNAHALRKYVNHKDGNKANFALDNLEWVTHKENIHHARDTGLFKRKTGQEEKVLRNKIMRELYESGKYTQDDLAKAFNISGPRVSFILGRLEEQGGK